MSPNPKTINNRTDFPMPRNIDHLMAVGLRGKNNPFTQRYPRSYSGRDYRPQFRAPLLEEWGCKADHLYEFADLSRHQRLTLVQEYHRLTRLDSEFVKANVCEQLDVFKRSQGAKAELNPSAAAFYGRMRDFVDCMWREYIGELDSDDI